jgi:hypothetical protein
MTYLLAIDVETTGQGLRTNFMTCIGAALISPEGKVLGTFSEYLQQPSGTVWEKRCIDEFWSKHQNLYLDTLEHVVRAAPVEEVMARFKKWVLDVTRDKKTLIVFDTAGFDQAWVDYNLGDTSCMYLLGYFECPFDIASYMLGVAQAEFDASSKKSFVKAKAIEFPKWDVDHDHNPANDATVTGLNAWWVMTHVQPNVTTNLITACTQNAPTSLEHHIVPNIDQKSTVAKFKSLEKQILDLIASLNGINKRWADIAVLKYEEATMAIVRSIMTS